MVNFVGLMFFGQSLYVMFARLDVNIVQLVDKGGLDESFTVGASDGLMIAIAVGSYSPDPNGPLFTDYYKVGVTKFGYGIE